jgi:gamma-glutamylcyclotransferase (GGCT)/AIG2-like uncharacterized protein YtfP
MNRGALAQIPFFVYGTLLPGQPNDHLWGAGIKAIETAFYVNGKLLDMGYYPMLVEEGAGTVRGKLITVTGEQYGKILHRLDRLEGYLPDRPNESSFQRVQRKVWTESGAKILSWVYIGNKRHAKKRRPIPDGDWVEYAAKTRPNKDNWWETVDTVLGLHDS